jgi:hypothetical protein
VRHARLVTRRGRAGGVAASAPEAARAARRGRGGVPGCRGLGRRRGRAHRGARCGGPGGRVGQARRAGLFAAPHFHLLLRTRPAPRRPAPRACPRARCARTGRGRGADGARGVTARSGAGQIMSLATGAFFTYAPPPNPARPFRVPLPPPAPDAGSRSCGAGMATTRRRIGCATPSKATGTGRRAPRPSAGRSRSSLVQRIHRAHAPRMQHCGLDSALLVSSAGKYSTSLQPWPDSRAAARRAAAGQRRRDGRRRALA